MKIHEAVSAIENQELSAHLEEARSVFEDKFEQLDKDDFETRGTYYYYLLRISLQRHVLYETRSEKHLYDMMLEYFEKQEQQYLDQWKSNSKDPILKHQAQAFYQIMERHFTTLETSYRRKEFRDAYKKVHLQKMEYRKRFYKFESKWGRFLAYRIWELSSLYSLSFFRWGMSCLFAVTLYAALFLIAGGLTHSNAITGIHWYDALHFSIATFTTLGFGDVFPATIPAKIIADIEVFNGYLMLGAFMAFVQKRLF